MPRSERLDVSGKLARLPADTDDGAAPAVFKALGNETRWRILSYLSDRFVTANQIAHDLGLPASTASRHIALLEDAGLVHTGMRPASRGLEKVVARRFEAILVDLPGAAGGADHVVDIPMPIGAYMAFEIEPTCGLASSRGADRSAGRPELVLRPRSRLRATALVRLGMDRIPVPEPGAPGIDRDFARAQL